MTNLHPSAHKATYNNTNMNENEQTTYTALYPYQLAYAAGVSRKTMSKWIAAHREHLASLGYTADTRLLPPSAVRFLCQFYCITLTVRK